MYMKILISLLVASLIGMSGFTGFAVDLIAIENFNAMKVGETPSGPWYVSGIDPEKSKILVAKRADKNEDLCLEVVDNDPTKSVIALTDFAGQTGDFTLSLDYMLKNGGGQPVAVTLYEKGVWPPAITLMANTNIYLYDSDKSSIYKNSVRMDAWHSITIHVYTQKETYDFYLDNEKVASNLKFRGKDNKSINVVQIGLGTSGSAATCYYDNFEIVKGIKSVQEVVPAIVPTPHVDPNADKLRIVPSFAELQSKMYQKIKKALVLSIAENNAIVNGEDKLIDPNPKIVPFTIDSRTLVPVRFIAECFGANVTWNENSETVMMKMSGKEIEIKLGSNEMKVNGSVKSIDVPANTYDDRTFLPLRAMVESIDKKVFWDDRGLIVISDEVDIFDRVRDVEMLDLLENTIKGGRELHSAKKYSSTFFSSRWFRKDGKIEPWDGSVQDNLPACGTISTTRQMMLTDDLWTYSNNTLFNPSDLKAWADTGTGLQMALPGMIYPPETPKNVLENGVNRDFDGNTINAPWVGAGSSRPGASACSEDFFQFSLATAKKEIDRGVYAIHHDDWLLDVQYSQWGGGFDPSFQAYFKEYLKRNYTTLQMKAFGIDDINTFDYKSYLQKELNITSNADYLKKRTQSKLDAIFFDCCKETTVNYHVRLRRELNQYAGRTVIYSVNSPMLYGITDAQAMINDIIDFQFGESKDGTYIPKNIAAWGATLTSMDKSSVLLPLPKTADAVKLGLAAAYANGHYMAFPWDVYMSWSEPRYFGTVADYAKEFHFIRQYEALFNNYEMVATVGLLAKRSDVNKASFENITEKFMKAFVPFKVLMSNEKYPKMEFTAEDLEGLSSIVTYTDVNKFSADEQKIIKESGIKVISMADMDTALANEYIAKATSAGGKIYTTFREKNDQSKVIHIINQSKVALDDIVVEVKNQYLPQGAKITYYRPGFDPIILSVEHGKISLPLTEIWGILSITSEFSANDLEAGSSFINVGNPIKNGSAGFSDGTLTISSKGMGLNLGVLGDNGSFDQISYVYQNVKKSTITDASFTAHIESMSKQNGNAGIMARKTLASNSPFVALIIDNGSLNFVSRDEYNRQTVTKKIKDISFPIFLKLERQNGIYKAYVSQDGTSFGEAVYTKELNLEDCVFGAFAAGGNDIGTNTVVVKSTALKQQKSTDSIARIGIEMPSLATVGEPAKATVFATLKNGDRLSLQANDVTFTSTNDAVISISADGTLNAKAEGMATIKATLSDTMEAVAEIKSQKPDPLIFKENFDGFSAGTIPDGYTFNNAKVVIGKSDTGNALIVGSDEEGKSCDAKIKTPKKSGIVTFEFDYKAVFGKNANAGGSRVIYVGGDAMIISITASPSGFEYFYGATAKNIAPIEQNRWYKIKVVANFIAQTANVFIDDTPVVTNGDFRNPADDFEGLWFGGYRVNEDTTYSWDNMNVYLN